MTMYEIFKMCCYDKHINFCAIDHKNVMQPKGQGPVM